MIRILLVALGALMLAPGLSEARQPGPLEASYDPSIPGLSEFAGHDFGAEITSPDIAIAYLRALEAAAPDRVRVTDYAQSWQGRTLAYAVIASADNMARMDEIQANLARLASGRISAEERDRLIAQTPPVVWLSYGVHGDEISSTDAGIRTAYHLLAARNDPMVEQILANTVIVVDAVQNPDGRARFIHSFESARGLEADEFRYSVEHDQPWPRGRSNHYLFDMNRDWFAMTQPETIGRVEALQQWWPVVYVDVHEMGGDSTYFFPPSADPFNPQITGMQRDGQDIVGRNNARWFDEYGYRYFTREIFDAFYPGYGDMWPALNGAIAMTYEQASARGLVWRRDDGSILTYADGVDRHFVASLSTAEAVASNAELFLRNFSDYRAEAANSSDGPQAVVFSRSGNRWGADRLARLLERQGVEVSALRPALQPNRRDACGIDLTLGGYIVPFNQPAGRLARTLMESDTPLPSDFVAEQESRRARGLDHQLYDVTAWSLPLMFNVEAASCRRTPSLETTPIDRLAGMEGGLSLRGEFGAVIPWTDAGQAALAAALAREGVVMRVTDAGFRMGASDFPRGSVVIRWSENDRNAPDLVDRLGREIGATAYGIDSSWTDEGPNLGSGSFRPLRAPRIAMAWGEGVSSLSAGATRFTLERRYGLPVTIIRASSLGRADLSGFDAVILPEQGWGGYGSTLGASGATALREFVSEGGTLIGLGDATRWLAGSDVDLVPTRRERAVAEGEAGGAPNSNIVDGVVLDDAADAHAAETPEDSMPDTEPGALARVIANADSWMSSGYDDGAAALVRGRDIYAPVSRDEGVTALRFAAADELVEAGYMWEENQAQLALKPFVIVKTEGAGQVVAFTQSPSVRAYLEGLDLLLLNAVLLGPAHSRALQ